MIDVHLTFRTKPLSEYTDGRPILTIKGQFPVLPSVGDTIGSGLEEPKGLPGTVIGIMWAAVDSTWRPYVQVQTTVEFEDHSLDQP